MFYLDLNNLIVIGFVNDFICYIMRNLYGWFIFGYFIILFHIF